MRSSIMFTGVYATIAVGHTLPLRLLHRDYYSGSKSESECVCPPQGQGSGQTQGSGGQNLVTITMPASTIMMTMTVQSTVTITATMDHGGDKGMGGDVGVGGGKDNGGGKAAVTKTTTASEAVQTNDDSGDEDTCPPDGQDEGEGDDGTGNGNGGGSEDQGSGSSGNEGSGNDGEDDTCPPDEEGAGSKDEATATSTSAAAGITAPPSKDRNGTRHVDHTRKASDGGPKTTAFATLTTAKAAEASAPASAIDSGRGGSKKSNNHKRVDFGKLNPFAW